MPTIDAGGWVVLAFVAAALFMIGMAFGWNDGAQHVKRRLIITRRKLRRRYRHINHIKSFNEGREFQKRRHQTPNSYL